jgi:hypothetical protein
MLLHNFAPGTPEKIHGDVAAEGAAKLKNRRRRINLKAVPQKALLHREKCNNVLDIFLLHYFRVLIGTTFIAADPGSLSG